MYFIKRKFTFCGGHRLSQHKGKCQNLHGHNYEVWVTIRAMKLDENDMVMDFAKLDEMVKPIIEEYDHSLVLNAADMNWASDLIKDFNFKIIIIDGEPTAEKFASTIYQRLSSDFVRKFNSIEVHQVEIYENEKSSAIYTDAVCMGD